MDNSLQSQAQNVGALPANTPIFEAMDLAATIDDSPSSWRPRIGPHGDLDPRGRNPIVAAGVDRRQAELG